MSVAGSALPGIESDRVGHWLVGVRARYLAGHMADDGFAASLLTSGENPDPGSAGSRAVLAEAARDALCDGGL